MNFLWTTIRSAMTCLVCVSESSCSILLLRKSLFFSRWLCHFFPSRSCMTIDITPNASWHSAILYFKNYIVTFQTSFYTNKLILPFYLSYLIISYVNTPFDIQEIYNWWFIMYIYINKTIITGVIICCPWTRPNTVHILS